jgi:hypothetical protein
MAIDQEEGRLAIQYRLSKTNELGNTACDFELIALKVGFKKAP